MGNGIKKMISLKSPSENRSADGGGCSESAFGAASVEFVPGLGQPKRIQAGHPTISPLQTAISIFSI
jgi:hypothetical protein